MQRRMTRFDLPVKAYASNPVVQVSGDARLGEALRRMEESGVSALAVVGAESALVGVLSRTDLVRAGNLRAVMAGCERVLSLPNLRARDRMVSPALTIGPDAPMREAAARMVEARAHRIFVVERGRPVGVVSTTDLMRAAVDERLMTPLSGCMSSPVLSVDTSEPIGRATQLLLDAHIHGLVVCDDGWPVGIYTQREALDAAALDRRLPVEQAMSCALLCLPPRTPIHRAAALALETRARRLLAVSRRALRGIASGLDVARLIAAH
jgi:CBS domain-containing protein